ncbi:MAG: hypothetical protein V2I50_07270, partial [Desulfuromusa sp.]|nr:hypothetical protein [Desulfuromusa sp.]
MSPEQIIQRLKNYRSELTGIMKRYVRKSNSYNINSNDDPKYRTIVIEITDLLDDLLGKNHYSKMIAQSFNEGISNYLGSLSYKSVEDITSVINAIIMRIETNPEILQRPEEKQEQADVQVGTPEKVTLKWL